MVSIITTRKELIESDNLQEEITNQVINLSRSITNDEYEQVRIIIGIQKIERNDGEYY